MNFPILFIGFNRPSTSSQVIAAIRAARPERLYFAADGPRAHVAADGPRCAAVRELASTVPSEVRTLFQSENLGCKRAVERAISWFFENEEWGIILEDDCLPDPSFFPYCEVLLQRYADDERVMTITGNNLLGSLWKPPQSYYFSKYMHCWGWATWRRAWRLYSPTLVSASSDETIIRRFSPAVGEVRYWRTRFRAVRRGKINTWDYGWQFSLWDRGGLTATPSVNLVKNIGFATDGTHTTNHHQTLALDAQRLELISHPATVEQSVVADQIEFTKVTRRGRKQLWDWMRSLIGVD